MSIQNLYTVLQNQYGEHATTNPDQGIKPSITKADWAQVAKLYINIRIAADAAAGTTGEYGVFRCNAPGGIQVTACHIIPEGAAAASDTLFATHTLNQRTNAGAPTAVSTVNSKTSGSGGSGNWVANTVVPMTTTQNITIAQGDTLTLQEQKASTGTQMPAFCLQVEYVEL